MTITEGTAKAAKWVINMDTITLPTWTFRKLVQAAKRSDSSLAQYLNMLAGIEDLKQIEEKANEKV